MVHRFYFQNIFPWWDCGFHFFKHLVHYSSDLMKAIALFCFLVTRNCLHKWGSTNANNMGLNDRSKDDTKAVCTSWPFQWGKSILVYSFFNSMMQVVSISDFFFHQTDFALSGCLLNSSCIRINIIYLFYKMYVGPNCRETPHIVFSCSSRP